MSTNLGDFKKRKDLLFCIDSDGCAIDTMDIKHIRCFGPRMVEEWGLSEWEAPILDRWNVVNLYSMTRGINRFKGLSKALKEIDNTYIKIDGVDVLDEWVEHSPELSNEALKKAIQENDNICLRKALSWSENVNNKINELSFEDKKPFDGVKEALEYAHQFGDVAIVSSANRQAVVEEWELYHLLEHVDIILAQDAGSKAYCIQELIKKGYDKEKVLMTGDAPGDYEAAKKNGVYYYPILVRHERDSWTEFVSEAVSRIRDGSYGGEYQQKKVDEFINNLN